MSERWQYIPATMAIRPSSVFNINHKGLSLHLASFKPQADYDTGGVDGFYSRSLTHSRISRPGFVANMSKSIYLQGFKFCLFEISMMVSFGNKRGEWAFDGDVIIAFNFGALTYVWGFRTSLSGDVAWISPSNSIKSNNLEALEWIQGLGFSLYSEGSYLIIAATSNFVVKM